MSSMQLRSASPARLALGALAVACALPLVLGCGSSGVGQGGFNLISIEEEWSMRDDLPRRPPEMPAAERTDQP